MRIAYLVGSDDAPRSVGSSARQDFVELLADSHLRFTKRELEPEDGLIEALDGELARRREPGHALLVFSGMATTAGEDVALRTSDYEASLHAIGQSLDRVPMDVLVLLDLHHEGPDDPFLAAEIVHAAKEALEGTDVALVVAASALESERKLPAAPLLHCLSATLRGAFSAVDTRSISAADLYERMREAKGFELLSAVGFMSAAKAFPLLVPPNVIVNDPASIPPPPSSTGATPESIRNGNAHFDAGRHGEAITEYKKRLLSLGPRDPERADVYFRIGRCKQELSSLAEAAHNFDKALALDPMHAGALDGACDVLAEQKDFRRLESMRRRHLDALQDPELREAQLAAIARAWVEDAERAEKALATIEQWAEESSSRDPLDMLVRAQDQIGRAPARVTARRRLAERLEGVEAAQTLVDAARIAQAELPGGKEAVVLCREALAEHPETLEALEIASAVLGAGRRFDDLIEVYEFVIERSSDAELGWDLSKKLGMLHRDVRDDAEGALRGFKRAAELRSDDVELLLWIAELHQAARDHDSAADVLRAAARVRPQDPDIVRRALWAFEKVRADDSAWNAACILDHLGEADINESLNADAHQPEGLIAARTTLSDADFELFAPERDEPLGRLLGVCAPSALPLCFDELKEAGELLDYESGALQEAGSTTMIARSLSWTCRLMGMETPPLYVVSDFPQGTAALALDEPVAIADRALGSGLELSELAFLWARALANLHGANGFLWACPSPQRLAKVVVGALLLSDAPGLEDLDGPPRLFAEALEERMNDGERDELAEASKNVSTRGARARIERWLDETALLGGRVGLLLSGDVRRAVDVVRRFPINGIPVGRQIDDLYQSTLSEEHTTLRRRLGINVHA